MNNVLHNNSNEYGIYELCRLRKSSDIRKGREYLKLPVPLIKKISELLKHINFFVVYDNKKHEFSLHEDKTLNHLRTLLEGPEKKEIVGFSNQPNMSFKVDGSPHIPYEIYAKKPASWFSKARKVGVEGIESFMSSINKKNTLKDLKIKDKDQLWVVKIKTEGPEMGTLYID